MSETAKKPNVIQEIIITSLGTILLGGAVGAYCLILDMLLI